jgi:2-methylcitrate dehydratase PrpD
MIEKTREHPKGSPQNPLSFEEIEGKFQSTAALHLNQKRTLELIEQVRRLDELKDVSSLAQSLST